MLPVVLSNESKMQSFSSLLDQLNEDSAISNILHGGKTCVPYGTPITNEEAKQWVPRGKTQIWIN